MTLIGDKPRKTSHILNGWNAFRIDTRQSPQPVISFPHSPAHLSSVAFAKEEAAITYRRCPKNASHEIEPRRRFE